KFPPPLVGWAVEEFTRPGEFVLDPFVGSGTTLVEARLHGRHSIAADIDPLARLLARVKSNPIDPSLLEQSKAHIQQVWDGYSQELEDELPAELGALPEFPNRDYWFHRRVQRELLLLRYAISRIANRQVRDFFLVVFSSIIIAKGPSSVANAL